MKNHEIQIFRISLNNQIKDSLSVMQFLDEQSEAGREIVGSSTTYDTSQEELLLTVIIADAKHSFTVNATSVDAGSSIVSHKWEQDLEQFSETIGGADI